MIYLDNAATSFPKPRCVADAMLNAQLQCSNPGRGGYFTTERAGKIVFDVRHKLANFFSAKTENVIFTKNCTEALNTAIKGSVKTGDHVVISSMEHNSVLRPIVKLKSQGKIQFDVFKVEPKSDDKTIENLIKCIRPNTRLIVCTHVSNVFGTVLPIKRIAEEAKKRNIVFVLDAAQSAGMFDVSFKNINADIICLPGHKGLLGPMGTGVMVLSDKANCEELIEGGTGSMSLVKNQPNIFPDKYESGTVNLPGIAGLGAGLDYIRRIGGVKVIREHEISLTKKALNEIKSIKNISVYDKLYSSQLAPIISLSVKGKHSEEVAEALGKMNIAVRGGYHCSYLAHNFYGTSKNGTVRVSTGIFNNESCIKNLCFCLNKIANGKHLC